MTDVPPNADPTSGGIRRCADWYPRGGSDRILGGADVGSVRIDGRPVPIPPSVPPSGPPPGPYDLTILATAGLTGYWPLSETSGTVAHDLKGSNPGVYAGGVTLNQAGAGTSSVAAQFDGTGKVTVPNAAELSANTQFTIEVWFQAARGDNPDTSWSPLVGKLNEDLGIGYEVEFQDFITSPSITTRIYSVTDWDAAGGSTDAGGHTEPAAAVWHYVVFAVDQSTRRLYVDSTLVLTSSSDLTATSMDSSPANLHFAWMPQSDERQSVASDVFFKGQLQRVAFYRDTVLSAGDVAAHWASGTS